MNVLLKSATSQTRSSLTGRAKVGKGGNAFKDVKKFYEENEELLVVCERNTAERGDSWRGFAFQTPAHTQTHTAPSP